MAEIAVSHRVVEGPLFGGDNFINGSGLRRRRPRIPSTHAEIHGHVSGVRVEAGVDVSALVMNARALTGGAPFTSDL